MATCEVDSEPIVEAEKAPTCAALRVPICVADRAPTWLWLSEPICAALIRVSPVVRPASCALLRDETLSACAWPADRALI